MLTVIIFLVILSLLVFVHEAGHFITAKKSGMSIEEFGFGFPPRIFGLKKGETTYSINWIPLGGFVKIKGENGELRNEPDSFSAQTFFKKSRSTFLWGFNERGFGFRLAVRGFYDWLAFGCFR